MADPVLDHTPTNVPDLAAEFKSAAELTLA
jgi:hypothetical protein